MKYAYCPACGYGGSGADKNRFIRNDVVNASPVFTPTVDPDGKVLPAWSGETEVDWDSQRPAAWDGTPQSLYTCRECGVGFDRFDAREEPSFITTCPYCEAKDQLEVIFAKASLEGVRLTPDGFSFQDAKGGSTEDELVRCNACGETFDLVDVTL